MSDSAPAGANGYYYSFGIHMGVSRGPVDQVRECRVGGKLGWQGNITASATVNFNAPNLFGGPKKEGGIQGWFKVMMGEPTQVAHSELNALCAPVLQPGFRRMLTIHYDGMISAVNPYPKPWSWRVRRALKGWDGDPIAPALAMIPLVGQVASTDAKPPTSLAFFTHFLTVPIVHYVTLNVDPFLGRTITEVYQIIDTTDGAPVDAVSIVYNGDGTATVNVKPIYINRVLTINYRYTQSGVPNIPGTQNLTPTTWVNPVRLHVSKAGGTVASITSVIDTEAVGGPVPVYFEVQNSLPAAEALLIVDPALFGRTLQVNYQWIPDGGFVGPQTQNFIVDDIGTPAQLQLIAPNGGAYVSTLKVITTNESSLSIDWTPSAVAFEEAGWVDAETKNIGLINILTPAYEGWKVQVEMFYDPNLVTNITPDANIRSMNPAHIIYECLTNREWGRGHQRAALDEASFTACAQTLFDEGFGLCLRWSRRDTIDAFIQGVLDHISAVLYADRSTALLTLKLIRGDYVKASLKLWTTSNGILEIKESSVNTSTSMINEIIVKYKDPIYNEERSVNEQNLASLQATGGVFNTQTKNYPGIPIPSLARRVALRDLRAQAEGLRRFKIVMDRRGWDLTPGKVMRIQDTSRNIPDMVVRIATFKDGTLTSGPIELEVAQDVFSMPAQSFTGEQPNTWIPPTLVPCIGRHRVFELPYFIISAQTRPADFALIDDTSAYFGAVAELAQPSNVNYDITVKDGAVTSEDQPALQDQLYCGYTP